MQLRTLLTLALAAATLTATAQKKKSAPKKADAVTSATSVQPREKEAPQPTKAQGVDGKTVSYAMGIAEAQALKQYLTGREGIDSTYYADVAQGLRAKLTAEESQRTQALAAGLRIAEMNRQQVLPSVNQQLTGKADTTYMDLDEFNRALAEVLEGKPTTFDADSAKKIVEQQFKYRSETYKAEQQAWLAANKKQPDVKTTKSGLQYKVLKKGAGVMPTDTSYVDVNYEGRLTDGTVFDSSYRRGKSAQFPVKGVIKGWQEALLMMPEGSEWELYIPAELAYGEQAQRQIPANSTLIFRVEMLQANAPKK